MTHSIEQTRQKNPMWVYEQNYRLFVRLFSGLCDGAEPVLQLVDANHRLDMVVLEQAPYTQTVRCNYLLGAGSHWLEDMRIVVRLYHDACLAEVLHYQGSEKLKPEYSASNPNFMHKDEKQQANRLFWEWLSLWVRILKRENDIAEMNS